MKRKRITKLLALFMTAALSLSICGCGGKNPAGQESGQGGSKQETAGTNTESGGGESTKGYWEMLDEVKDSSELPDWNGEKLEVVIWMAAGTDYTFGEISPDNVFLKELERVTGVVFNVEDSYGNGGENIDAKLPKLVASKDFPTMMTGWDIDSQIIELYENGYLADLTDYYNNGDLNWVQYYIPEDAISSKWTTIKSKDGKYYGIPSNRNILNAYAQLGVEVDGFDPEWWNKYMSTVQSATGVQQFTGVYMRDDILKAMYPDALTLSDIEQIWIDKGEFTSDEIYDIGLKSQDDFWQFLRDVDAFLDENQFVGLNGKPVEVTHGPNSGADNWYWMTSLAMAVAGVPLNSDYFVTVDLKGGEDGLLRRAIDTDFYVNYMRNLNTLVNEDVISKNSLIDDAATTNEKVLNGQYALSYGWPQVTIPTHTDAGWSYRPIWVDCGISDEVYGFGTSSTVAYMGIFKDSLTEEQLEQLVHCINYMASPIGAYCQNFGPATAGLWEFDENGERVWTDPQLILCKYNPDKVATDSAEYIAAADYAASLLGGTRSDGKTYFDNYYMSAANRFLTSDKYRIEHYYTRSIGEALKYYNPAILPGGSYYDNIMTVSYDHNVYGFGQQMEEMKEFWSARSGFEDIMKKCIAGSPSEFDAGIEELRRFADDNALTVENVQKFNDMWVEINHDELMDYGVLGE